MAQAGYTPIRLYSSSTPAAVPTAGNLATGELAINIADGKLFYKDSGGVVQVIADGPFSIGGSNTQVQYNNSGALAGSANLTFDGSTLAVNSVSVGRGGGGVASNTVVGSGALASNTVGAQITAVGNGALAVNTASFVTAVGYQALNANTTAVWNTAVGGQAAAVNTTGQYVTAVGYQTLYNSITGDQQTALGFQSMHYMRGSNNTAVGMQAMIGSATPASNTGTDNTAVGRYSLYTVSSGNQNTAIGSNALYNNLAVSSQTAIGYQAMYYMRGGNNTAIGVNAMAGSTTPLSNTGDYNLAAGVSSLNAITSGVGNVALGVFAGLNLTTGNSNIFVGYNSGSTITTGAKHAILGSYNGNQSGLDIRTANNYVVLSDGDGNPRAYWNGNNGTMNGPLTVIATLRTAVQAVTSAATITPTGDSGNQYNVTALAVPATIAAPSGTPVDGQKLLLRIKDNGTARALTWNAIYRVIGTVLPTTTVATKTTYVGCVYNSADAVWDVVAVTTQI